jgi:hypothetical protein
MRKPKILFAVLLLMVASSFLSWAVLHTKSNRPQSVDIPAVAQAPHFETSIPQKALLNNYLTVSVKTAAGTKCKLTFITPSGETQTMDALADEKGECVWSWKLEESAGKGDGRLIFTIDGVSDTHFIQIFANF